MIKLIVLSVALFANAVHAENSSAEIHPPVLSPGLKDCKFYYVRYERPGIMPDQVLYVTRCPGESTATSWKAGKQEVTSLTVEDIAREAVLKKLSKTERQLLGVEK